MSNTQGPMTFLRADILPVSAAVIIHSAAFTTGTTGEAIDRRIQARNIAAPNTRAIINWSCPSTDSPFVVTAVLEIDTVLVTPADIRSKGHRM